MSEINVLNVSSISDMIAVIGKMQKNFQEIRHHNCSKQGCTGTTCSRDIFCNLILENFRDMLKCYCDLGIRYNISSKGKKFIVIDQWNKDFKMSNQKKLNMRDQTKKFHEWLKIYTNLLYNYISKEMQQKMQQQCIGVQLCGAGFLWRLGFVYKPRMLKTYSVHEREEKTIYSRVNQIGPLTGGRKCLIIFR